MADGKPILEWLETIKDEDVKAKAITNFKDQIKHFGLGDQDQNDILTEDLVEAIGNAFIWGQTPEGHKFWLEFVTK